MDALSKEVLIKIFESSPLSFSGFLSLRATCRETYLAMSMARDVTIVAHPNLFHAAEARLLYQLCPTATVLYQFLNWNRKIVSQTGVVRWRTILDLPIWHREIPLRIHARIFPAHSTPIHLDKFSMAALEDFLEYPRRNIVTFATPNPTTEVEFTLNICFGDPPAAYTNMVTICRKLGITPQKLHFHKLGFNTFVPNFLNEEFNESVEIPGVKIVCISGYFSRAEVSVLVGSPRFPRLPDAERVTFLSECDPTLPGVEIFRFSIARKLTKFDQLWVPEEYDLETSYPTYPLSWVISRTRAQ